MMIDSQIMEGLPNRCIVCGMTGMLCSDGVCPNCGELLWDFQSHVGDNLGLPPKEINAIKFDMLLGELFGGIDCLEVAETLGEFEEKTGMRFPADFWERFHSVRDVIEFLRGCQED